MAQTAFKMDAFCLEDYDSMLSLNAPKKLLVDLRSYIESYDFDSNNFETFIAVFSKDAFNDELLFEDALWHFIQLLHENDSYSWDKEVSKDPKNPHFSMSLAGKAFYLVGMHPASSRVARQSPYPSIAFNLHWQFDRLRDMGIFNTLRDRIRDRDKASNGSINPVLHNYGISSEARQYSGRHIEVEWQCPFKHKTTAWS